MLGYAAYAYRFAGSIDGVRGKIPYLKELGVTYLHLMPVLRTREGENDGGYAQDAGRVRTHSARGISRFCRPGISATTRS